ncbi:hypothetical protein STEG23_026078, partial [Scotinomys teguina]
NMLAHRGPPFNTKRGYEILADPFSIWKFQGFLLGFSIFGKQLGNNTAKKHSGESIDTEAEELSNKELLELEEETNKDTESEKQV